MSDGPITIKMVYSLTIEEIYARLADTLCFPDEADHAFREFVLIAHDFLSGEDPVIDLIPTVEETEGGSVFRVSINLAERGDTLASVVFPTSEEATQFIDIMLLLQDLSENGFE